MNDVVKVDMNKVPAALLDAVGGMDANDDLSSGVSGGFSVLSIRGSKWRVKSGGEEEVLTDSQGDTLASVRVVIVKGNKHVSKNYYEGGFVEGSSDAPSCFSIDGVKPDSSVENPVSVACANCPKNQFGSRITDSGSKAKACADNRRIAIVPEGDLPGARFNGPMLLRVPAASLSDLASYAKGMSAKGFPYNTVVTKLSFDTETAYPKIKFQAARALKEDEANELAQLYAEGEYVEKINYILAEAMVDQPTAEAAGVREVKEEDDPLAFADDAAPPQEEPEKPKAKAKAKPAKKEEPKSDPEPATVGGDDGLADDDINALLSALDSSD